MKFSRMVSLGLMLALAFGSSFAQELRLGFVSTDRVLKEAGVAKVAQAKLEQEFSKREKEINDFGARLKSESEAFERDATTLPESQRLAKQRQLLDQDRDFQRKRREFQEDLNARKNEELQQVLLRANKAIKDLAVAEKYDFIFQEAVYVNPRNDITDKVIKALSAPGVK